MEETLIKRVMPNSLEAEQSVIGSMIMDQDAIVTAMEILLQEDFYHKQYGILFDAMIELYSSGQPVDLVFLIAAPNTEENQWILLPCRKHSRKRMYHRKSPVWNSLENWCVRFRHPRMSNIIVIL